MALLDDEHALHHAPVSGEAADEGIAARLARGRERAGVVGVGAQEGRGPEDGVMVGDEMA
ncbi:MAG: hypothetical protein ACI8W8_002976, partial [Rhodothermales bacterium]